MQLKTELEAFKTGWAMNTTELQVGRSLRSWSHIMDMQNQMVQNCYSNHFLSHWDQVA